MRFNHFYMIRSFFIVAYRNLVRNKTYSFINMAGLAVGMAAFFLIVQYVSFEMSYDTFHGKTEIYRVAHQQVQGGVKNNSALNYIGIRKLVHDNFPEIKSFTGFESVPANTGFLFGYKNKMHMEFGNFITADSNFFKVFPTLLKEGDPDKILKDPHNLIISESIAKKMFGDERAIGQELINYQDFIPGPNFIVAGVMRDLPDNAHFHASFVSPIEASYLSASEYWTRPTLHTYLTLPSGADAVLVENKLNAILKHVQKTHPSTQGASVFLQPVTSIHLNSSLNDELEPGGSQKLIYVLSFIGVLILIVAWINYINIEISRFLSRVREIGVRRIIGSGKEYLVIQFLVEFFCVNLVAIILATGIVLMVFPHFAYWTGIPITTLQLSTTEVWLGALAVFIAGTLIAGIYPALYLLRLDVALSLKGKFKTSTRAHMQSTMMLVQFVVSLVLVGFLLVVYQQLEHMRLTNKKIELDYVISLRNPTAYADELMEQKEAYYKAFESRLLQNPNMSMMTGSSAIPGAEIGFTLVDNLKRHSGDPYDPTRKKLLFVDYNFIPLFGLNLKAGRNYSVEAEGQDASGKIILNESAIRSLGFTTADEAIGQVVSLPLWDWLKPDYEIIGVVADYHHESIKKEICPTIFFLNQGKFQQVFYSIKIKPGSNPQQALASIEKAWKGIFPEKPFEYFFLNDYYDQQFKSELHFARTFSFFGGVAVFLACLGVLGMTLYEANSRQREISIRKVLGASLENLIALLYKRYFRLILIAIMLSVPITYMTAGKWLSFYPVKIGITVIFFLLPVLLLIGIIILASGIQTYRTANSNPVNHLKYE